VFAHERRGVVKNKKGSLALQELKLEHLLLNSYCTANIKNSWFNYEVPFVKYVSYTKFFFHAAYTLVSKVTYLVLCLYPHQCA